MNWQTYINLTDNHVPNFNAQISVWSEYVAKDSMPITYIVVRDSVVVKSVSALDHPEYKIPNMMGWANDAVEEWINEFILLSKKALRIIKIKEV